MLKKYFISFLGALTAFWVSLMLLFIIGMVMVAGSIVASLGMSQGAVDVKNHSVLVITLDDVIQERSSAPDLFKVINGETGGLALDKIIKALAAAKEDKRIDGVFLECAGGAAGVATRQEIAEALADFRSSGKWIAAYADNYTQGEYYLASVADDLFLNPAGMVDLHGFGGSMPFFKGLLDKAGVEMQVFKVGTYKSAVEPYILTQMSEPSRMQTRVYLDALWGNAVDAIAANRGIPSAEINEFADSLYTLAWEPREFVTRKYVDELRYRHQVIDFLKEKVGVDKDDDLPSVRFQDYLATAKVPHDKSNKNKIAVYYAEGDITENGRDGIASERVVPDILDLADDDDIAGLVLRVNSGGGSAFASEQIWEALQVLKQKGKKLYVSMGDAAASGGYYISCGADKIYADSTTLTGSIGIFGMIPCAKELLNDKLGVNFDFVTTNANSTFPTLVTEVTPFQRKQMQANINRGYELFTSRCAEGRGLSQDSIKAVGGGRVWAGVDALKIGLVDELGSLTAAVEGLASELGFKKYQVVDYPNPKKDFMAVLAELDYQMKARALKEELGPVYPVYDHVRKLATLDPVQARAALPVIE
ncbi:MAG: signal peptide peptidase SppA [Muribaculaceae bacterium]|nr:signal peptide peptidase SppA [Muribaculaceae bacterium]